MTSSFEKYAVGALIGGVVGAAMALLLAPRSGEETREMIRQEMEAKRREAAEALKESSEAIQEKALVLKERVVDMSTQLEEKGKDAIARFKAGYKTTPEATS